MLANKTGSTLVSPLFQASWRYGAGSHRLAPTAREFERGSGNPTTYLTLPWQSESQVGRGALKDEGLADIR